MEKSKFDFENVKADMDSCPLIITETDTCVWCKKKALITDNSYFYCSEKCRELFIDDCQKAIEETLEEIDRDRIRRFKEDGKEEV